MMGETDQGRHYRVMSRLIFTSLSGFGVQLLWNSLQVEPGMLSRSAPVPTDALRLHYCPYIYSWATPGTRSHRRKRTSLSLTGQTTEPSSGTWTSFYPLPGLAWSCRTSGNWWKVQAWRTGVLVEMASVSVINKLAQPSQTLLWLHVANQSSLYDMVMNLNVIKIDCRNTLLSLLK